MSAILFRSQWVNKNPSRESSISLWKLPYSFEPQRPIHWNISINHLRKIRIAVLYAHIIKLNCTIVSQIELTPIVRPSRHWHELDVEMGNLRPKTLPILGLEMFPYIFNFSEEPFSPNKQRYIFCVGNLEDDRVQTKLKRSNWSKSHWNEKGIVNRLSCKVLRVLISHLKTLIILWTSILLIHCGLVMPCGIRHLGQHQLNWWFVAQQAASHYLDQCWLIDNWTLENKFQWILKEDAIYLFIFHKHTIEYMYKMSANCQPLCSGLKLLNSILRSSYPWNTVVFVFKM